MKYLFFLCFWMVRFWAVAQDQVKVDGKLHDCKIYYVDERTIRVQAGKETRTFLNDVITRVYSPDRQTLKMLEGVRELRHRISYTRLDGMAVPLPKAEKDTVLSTEEENNLVLPEVLRSTAANLKIGGIAIALGAGTMGLGIYYATETASSLAQAEDNRNRARTFMLLGAGGMVIGGFFIADGGSIIRHNIKLVGNANGIGVAFKF